MSAPTSDALVFFGVTGDLAFKKIFPSFAGADAGRGRGSRSKEGHSH